MLQATDPLFDSPDELCDAVGVGNARGDTCVSRAAFVFPDLLDRFDHVVSVPG
jgi:hypothetical protein